MQNLVLLHGALGAASQFDALAATLKDRYHLHIPNFSGHGGSPFDERGFSIPVFAQELLSYLDERRLDQVSIFGYSMGGYVALYLAAKYPERIRRVMTLATKFHWDEATAAKEVGMLNPTKIQQKVPAFARFLEERHIPNDWKQVVKHTADMMLELGATNILDREVLQSVHVPVRLLLGDRDKMVTVEETQQAYRQLPQADWEILPFTDHPLEQVPQEELMLRISSFFRD